MKIRRSLIRLLIIVSTVAVLCLVGSLAFVHFWLDRPMGSGPAGPMVSCTAFQRVWSTRPVMLVGIGDSVTAGFGASDRQHSYFQRLIANPPDEFPELKEICLKNVFPRLKSLNLAVSGSTSIDHLKNEIPRLKKADPDTLGIVVMTTGGNDLIHNYGRTPPEEGAMFGATLEQARPWIGHFEQRMKAMVSEIKQRFPDGCHIFLAKIFDPTDGAGMAWSAGLPAWKDSLEILSAYNAVLNRIAETDPAIHLVNIHDPFLGHGIYFRQFWRPHYQRQDPYHWFYENFEDPNDRGYDALRCLFLNEMAKVFHD